MTDINSSSCSFVAKLPGQFEAVKLGTVAADMQSGQYLVTCPDSVRGCQGTYQVEAQQGNLQGKPYTIDSFQSLAAMQSRAVPGHDHAASQTPPCVPNTQTCSVCQSVQAASTSMVDTDTDVC